MCGHGSHVVDSRAHEGSLSVRRRRQCDKCGVRWTTYELRLRDGHDTLEDAITSVLDEVKTLLEVVRTDRRSAKAISVRGGMNGGGRDRGAI